MTRSIFELPAQTRSLFIVSDIHANAPALEAVLAHRRPDEPMICAGDFVGYYADPNEVCDRFRSLAAIVVRGNHDAFLIGALRANPKNREKYRLDWTDTVLTKANRNWLASLPQTAEVRPRGPTAPSVRRIIIRHANPIDEETYLYPDTDLAPYSLEEGTTMIVGHTHHPMDRAAGLGRFVNPGSVGQARDRKPGAPFARLHLDTGRFETLRADYDVAGYQSRLRAGGWPEETIAFLSRN